MHQQIQPTSHAHKHTHTHTHASTHARTHKYTHTHTLTHTHTCTHTNMHTHAHEHAHRHRHTHTHTHTQTNKQTNKQTHIHAHEHARARTQTHTHTHTHTEQVNWSDLQKRVEGLEMSWSWCCLTMSRSPLRIWSNFMARMLRREPRAFSGLGNSDEAGVVLMMSSAMAHQQLLLWLQTSRQRKH